MSEKQFPPQHLETDSEADMVPRPQAKKPGYKGSDKLRDKVAIITGGDSGIGRAVAILFAKEGANSVIAYLKQHEDAEQTKRLVEQEGGKCITIAGDIGDESFCQEVVEATLKEFGKLDILVNNAAEQQPQKSIK